MSGQPETDVSTGAGAGSGHQLTERYGGRSRRRRAGVVVGAVLISAIFLGWLSWAIWANSDPQVTSQLQSFDVTDDHHVTAVLEVHLSNDTIKASCTISALAYDHSTVGETVLHPDPARGDQQPITFSTDRRATSVESDGCTTADQNKPR